VCGIVRKNCGMNIFRFRTCIYSSTKYLLAAVVREVVLVFLSCDIFEATLYSLPYRVTIFQDFVVTYVPLVLALGILHVATQSIFKFSMRPIINKGYFPMLHSLTGT
jgi:hypothetical protein